MLHLCMLLSYSSAPLAELYLLPSTRVCQALECRTTLLQARLSRLHSQSLLPGRHVLALLTHYVGPTLPTSHGCSPT